MPRTTFDSENKKESAFSYPQLKLDKGERARILCIEAKPDEGPFYEYVHTLRAPRVVNGAVQMETVEEFGRTVTKPARDFMGRPLCVGDMTAISAKGSDPNNCPLCDYAAKSDSVTPPSRRFAMHVVLYQTTPGGFQITDPPQAALKVWQFTDYIFNQLVDFNDTWKDLRKHDLLLGPCTNKNFQKFEINIAPDAAWLTNGDDFKTQIVELYKNNQAPNLSALIGRKLSKEAAQAELDRVIEREQQVSSDVTEDPIEAASQAAELDDLLDGLDGEETTEAPKDEAPPTADEDVTPPVVVAKAEGSDAEFDDLLAELDDA